MTEGLRLMEAGMPLENAISNCHAMHREGTLPEFVAEHEGRHVCECGGAGHCPNCPNKKK